MLCCFINIACLLLPLLFYVSILSTAAVFVIVIIIITLRQELSSLRLK